jgi:hypothetical protein
MGEEQAVLSKVREAMSMRHGQRGPRGANLLYDRHTANANQGPHDLGYMDIGLESHRDIGLA